MCVVDRLSNSSTRTGPILRACVLTASVVASMMLTACQTQIHRRPTGPIAGVQGRASEAVLFAPDIERAMYEEPVDLAWMDSRRDMSLSVRGHGSRFDGDTWSDSGIPSLDRARRIYLLDSGSSRPDSYIYFRP